jgi:CRP/FNR family transcriptional regulator/CRP/FNR family nitrogen fixation transcriptional regulator
MTAITANQPASRDMRARPDTLDLLEQFGSTVQVAREQEIHPEGEPAQFCYRVVSGCVRAVRLTEDGRRQVAEFFLKGDMFGLDDLDAHEHAAEAVSDTVLRRYPRRMVENLAESHTALSRRLRDLAFSRLRAAHARILLLGRGTAPERIAAFLLEMESRLDHRGGGVMALPMGRADMADHLGLTVETICRVLAGMKRDGTVSIARTGVCLRDHAALEDIASPLLTGVG